MSSDVSIRILERENNRRGDLFGLLMADLFVALGFEQPRLNVHKSGRELDLVARHRLESRQARAECKAMKKPVGGDDVNKFVGALDVEKGRAKNPITGYYISLSGYRETAIEQEKDRQEKIVLLNGARVIDELVKGRILVPKEKATDLAGRLSGGNDDLVLDPQMELLAHERGWVWAVYYTQGKARTHFALIHSDGTQLLRPVAEEIIVSDRDCGGKLSSLTCLNPAPPTVADEDQQFAAAREAYQAYLAHECGHILLEGRPADTIVSNLQFRLESLFVPLRLDLEHTGGEQFQELLAQRGEPIGSVLDAHSRLAILAGPGGGKSTLINRLAVAYSDHSRREEVDDGLPDRDWLPLFFRCRELRDYARGSFANLLEMLSQREPMRQQAAAFRAVVDRALLEGRVLLLVDGLDEISDPGDRGAFVNTLRTTLLAYPNIALVVTSREVGFRHIATHLEPFCTRATLSPFDEGDIRRLTIGWHREVVGDTEEVYNDAVKLAQSIIASDRIRRLASNPMLLTTLLLVKRWIRTLPTKRGVLYGEAVKVLLRTWNVQGYEPISEEEALPQLCYLASTMMLKGMQEISRPKLATVLREARQSLPTELGYVEGTVDDFIDRVEYRSSLLIRTGQTVEDGRLVDLFEFRHQTFREFLTAMAMVESWYPNWKETDSLASVLQPYFEVDDWRQVIPLAASLGGKATEELIEVLTERVNELEPSEPNDGYLLVVALGNCLADEAPARPETIQLALRALLRLGKALARSKEAFLGSLVRSRYGVQLRQEAWQLFSDQDCDLEVALQAAIAYSAVLSANSP